jgi:rod shape-determining protein MreD
VRRYLEPVLAVVLAFALYAILGKIAAPLVLVFNPFSWVVLYFGLTREELFGAFTGSVCGLLQDSLTVGVFGVGGLSKTLMGFACGYISRKINVAPVVRNLVFLCILALAELAVWKGLAAFLFGARLTADHGLALLQPVATALATAGLFRLSAKLRREGA